MSEYQLTMSENQALFFGAFFDRFGENDKLEFAHPAEYLVLMNLAGRIDNATSTFLSSEYTSLPGNARRQIAEGYEVDLPGIESRT